MNIRILFVSANPGSTEKLDLADELRNFQQSLQGHDVDVTLLPAAQPEDLALAMETGNYDVVHFSGHAKDEGILMRRPDGNSTLVTPDELLKLFQKRDGKTKLAFLNACNTKETAKKIKDAVDMVIGTSDKLNDAVAKTMSQLFYKSLGEGKTLEGAYTVATDYINSINASMNVYKEYWDEEEKKKPLISTEKTDTARVKMHGAPSWDKHFHVSLVEQQISALKTEISLNQKILFGLLGAAGIIFCLILYYVVPPIDWKAMFPFTPEEKTALIGDKPLLEWLATVGAAIPAFIAGFQQRFLLNGNERLRLLKQLLETIKSSDKMSDEAREQLRALMEHCVRGANAK